MAQTLSKCGNCGELVNGTEFTKFGNSDSELFVPSGLVSLDSM